jgi:hypothetical protein
MSKVTTNFTEEIVCLANSRKISGRCLAGKRIHDKRWCRPVSNRNEKEISEEERRYEDGSMPRVLDIIKIPCIQACPHGHQNENVLIDDRLYWEKAGRASWDEVHALVETDADLWLDGYSAYYNTNNRIPNDRIDIEGGSLRLIELDKIVLHVGPKAPEYGNMKQIVRASFQYKGQKYKFDVTDPAIEQHFINTGQGDYKLNSVIVCISLGEPFKDGYAYKLIAAIITKSRAGA